MKEQRNPFVDVTRLVAAIGIILCHVNLTDYGTVGIFLGQFLSVRFSVMFFLAIIGFYLEKSYEAGRNPIPRRLSSFLRAYGSWSLIYLALSFVMVVLIQKVPLGQFLVNKGRDLLLSGSYYHFWFYPAVIYSLLFIGGVKKLLGHRALQILVPLASLLYLLGLLGTGYLPMGQQMPVLGSLYRADAFDTLMPLFFLGFPSMVLGMAVAHKKRTCSGSLLMLAVAAYIAESAILCFLLGWWENPQMLLSTPVLTALFLCWVQNRNCNAFPKKVNLSLLRVISSGMYNIHPLILAMLAIVIPNLNGLWTFLLCTVCSVAFGQVLYYLRKRKIFALFI